MMGPGMMGQGYCMGPGMMGPGYGYGQGYGMGPGMMGQGYGMGSATMPEKDLSADDVRARLDRSLSWHGNKRIKVGEVKDVDDDTISADIVTQDGSLVQRFMVNRHTGQMQQIE